jgi:tetratricopeptide (TPR) repeat protein
LLKSIFFTLNIVFVLQVVGAGQGYIADRFTYVPYIGLFFIYAVLFENVLKKFQSHKILLYSTLIVYLILISAQTYKQIKIWENGETLWTDVIKKQPTVTLAYNNLGHYYNKKNETEKALINYNIGIALEPLNAKAYNNRGKIFFDRGEFDKAFDDYNKSLSLDPEYYDALANRGAVYGVKKQYDKALDDISRTLSGDSENAFALSNRGFIYYQLKQYENSIADCKKYLELKPNDTEVINLLGLCYAKLNNFDSALHEYSRAIQINPANPIYFLNRSYSFNAKGDKTNALKDAQHASQMGFNVPPGYLEMLNNNK